MKTLNLLIACIALVAFVACSKDKKKDTTPTATDTVTTDDNRGEAKADTEPTSDDTDTDAPAIDPASLTEVIYFEFDSSDLSDDARSKLNENADWLKEDGDRTVTIEGHTDEVGTPGYNLALGERRARAARAYMVRLGIDEDRIRIITYGEEKPASSSDSENRRSVFLATSS
jgi:peptidoglycan-associated lipoprotein